MKEERVQCSGLLLMITIGQTFTVAKTQLRSRTKKVRVQTGQKARPQNAREQKRTTNGFWMFLVIVHRIRSKKSQSVLLKFHIKRLDFLKKHWYNVHIYNYIFRKDLAEASHVLIR